MKQTIRLASIGAVILGAVLAAERQQPGAKPGTIRGQTQDLGRPTRADDPLPLFNFDDYFVGIWMFDWDVPEGPLGPAGRISGKTVYRAVEGKFYEAETDANGPAGPFKMRELIAYQKEFKSLARHVTDGRGFSFFQIGPIGGDLGGYYTIHYESAPLTYNNQSIRIKTIMALLSPINYKVSWTVSLDGGRFMNYGSPWWRKDVPGAREP